MTKKRCFIIVLSLILAFNVGFMGMWNCNDVYAETNSKSDKIHLSRDEVIPSLEVLEKKLNNCVALFVGSSNAYAKDKKVIINENDTDIKPFMIEETIYTPLEFVANSLDGKVINSKKESIVYVSIYNKIIKMELENKNISIKSKTKNQKITWENPVKKINNTVFIPLVDFCKAIDKQVFIDERGLAVINDTPNFLDKNKDKFIIDGIIKLLIYDYPDGNKVIEDIIKVNPNKSHPRLLASEQKFNELKSKISHDPYLKKWYEDVKKKANRYLKKSPIKYKVDGRIKNDDEIRRRIMNLSMVYKMTGDKKYKDRLWKEIETAASFKDWAAPLSVSLITEGFSIGYDWLYNDWNEEQRDIIRTAIIEKGLKWGLDAFKKESWFVFSYPFVNNHTPVFDASMIMASLAIGDEQPELAGEVAEASLRSLEDSWLMEYAPDGGASEGPGYWGFAFKHLVLGLASLDTAVGTDYGYSNTPGLIETAFLPDYMIGALTTFNYADSGSGQLTEPGQFWIANKTNNADLAGLRLSAMERYKLKGEVEDILWYDENNCNTELLKSRNKLPKDKYYRNVEVATMRSNWDNRNGFFVGFKAGRAWGSHRQLDIGTFVLDAGGLRWAYDLGKDDYGLPGYFKYDKERFHYYRNNPRGHNTIVISPESKDLGQDPKSFSKIIKFVSKPKGAFAIADLTPAYKNYVTDAKRGIKLYNDRTNVMIQDEIHTKKPINISWRMNTIAKVQISDDGKSAILKRGNQKLLVQLIASEDAVFTIQDSKPDANAIYADRQDQNDGYKRLSIDIPDVKDLNLTVKFTLLKGDEVPLDNKPKQMLLKDWEIPDGDLNTDNQFFDEADGNMKNVSIPEGAKKLNVIGIEASDIPQPQNAPENTVDNDLVTRWSARGEQWIKYDLGASKKLVCVSIALFKGDIRSSYFDIQVSNDGTNWENVYVGSSSGSTLDSENYVFDPITARYVRIIGYGNQGNDWNSYNEVSIYGLNN